MHLLHTTIELISCKLQIKTKTWLDPSCALKITKGHNIIYYLYAMYVLKLKMFTLEEIRYELFQNSQKVLKKWF